MIVDTIYCVCHMNPGCKGNLFFFSILPFEQADSYLLAQKSS